ncbi:uncharacterized protein [Spinacia oleracea]|uniref:Uncharacterized protein isoform X2 n=1 Tax=Spinacia oleracea TaxID=3562 RepID=A0ABM3QWS8_SPIOL|nr:uncharacterized protein LOC110787882 isoform X2 [Spinacia oleracea]
MGFSPSSILLILLPLLPSLLPLFRFRIWKIAGLEISVYQEGFFLMTDRQTDDLSSNYAPHHSSVYQGGDPNYSSARPDPTSIPMRIGSLYPVNQAPASSPMGIRSPYPVHQGVLVRCW